MTEAPTRTPATTPADVAEAQALVRQREEEHAEALGASDSLEARLADGDERVTADDLTHAGNAVKRAGLLLDHARKGLVKSLAAASADRAKQSPDIANATAAMLQRNAMAMGLFGVHVGVLDAMPTSPEDVPAVPGIYLTQTQATKHDTHTGLTSGEAEMFLIYQDSLPLDPTELRQGIKATAVREGKGTLEMYSGRMGGPKPLGDSNLIRYGFLIIAKNLQPEMPVIAGDLQPFRLNALAAGLVQDIRRIASGPQAPVKTGLDNVRIVGTKREGGGVVRTVEVAVVVSPKEWDAQRAYLRVQDIVDEMAGTFVTGVGRITEAHITGASPINKGRIITIRFAITSRSV